MYYLQTITLLFFIISTFLDAPWAMSASADNMTGNVQKMLSAPGRVLIVRHALAPGTGDPDNFRIDDCATQRNLDTRGRKQALAMGEWLKAQGVESARVFSSQWCRCKETAELLKFGPVTELPALNSFFQRWDEKESRIEALNRFLSELEADAPLTILVTHQVTITALTGVYPSSGTGVLLILNRTGGFEIGQTVNFE